MSQRFIVFVIDSLSASGTAEEFAAIDAFNDQLRAHGHWVAAGGLAAPSVSLLIDNRCGIGRRSAESLLAGPESYSGFWLIDCKDSHTAQQLALEGSRACHRKVELRALLGDH